MQVVKRDGRREDVKIEKILTAVNRACRGVQGVESLEIAKRTINGLHEGSTTQELDNLSISTAVMLMADEPNYSKVAARMLSESLHKEVGRDMAFRDYIKKAAELGVVADSVLGLANQDVETIRVRDSARAR
jgi:ribonucleoside-diphosphate reductase alpha chain